MKRLIVDSCITLYETINTRLTRNEYHQMEGLFEHLMREGHVNLVADTKYKEEALRIVRLNTTDKKTYSLVDMIIRLMMEDVTLGDIAVFSFNVKDFVGVNDVKVISPEWIQMKS